MFVVISLPHKLMFVIISLPHKLMALKYSLALVQYSHKLARVSRSTDA
jgi:hypothetical protein